MHELVAAFRNHPLVAERPALRQFLKFGIVGASNTILDFCIYLALTRFTGYFFDHKLLANVISFTGGVTNSFIWNKFWTFKNTDRAIHIQYPKFFLGSLSALAFNQAVFWVAHYQWGVHDLIAKLLAVGVVMFWNFAVQKYWTFSVRTGGNKAGKGLAT